jgi:tRNA dimethylallyltransferase
VQLALRLNGVILSADSRQIYRDFDIGTAKPTLAEQQQIPHYFIDICDPTTSFTVAEYQHQAQEIIEQLHLAGQGIGLGETRLIASVPGSRGVGESESQRVPHHTLAKRGAALTPLRSVAQPSHPHTITPLLVGGTGLYIRSITHGLKIPRVPPQMELRSQLQQLGQKQCYAFLQQVDPAAAQKIHLNDAVRTLRALEVFYTTGQPLSQQQGEHPPRYPILQIGLDCLNATQSGSGVAIDDPLTRRIAQRTEQMMATGFVDEVERLCGKYGANLPLLNTLGYAEVKLYLTGQISLPEAIAQTVLHTRQFAKRQRTWFRADPTIHWFDADDPTLVEQVWSCVQQFIASVEHPK